MRNRQPPSSLRHVAPEHKRQLQVVVGANKSNINMVVPWDKLVFSDAKLNGDKKVLMPNAMQGNLDKMQAFDYQQTNHVKK